jgi:hypothetical protein
MESFWPQKFTSEKQTKLKPQIKNDMEKGYFCIEYRVYDGAFLLFLL